MTDLRQAAQQALEALETLMIERESIYDKAITAIKEALAQPEFTKHEVENADNWSEWVCPDPKGYLMKCCDCGLVHEAEFGVVRYKSETEDCDIVDDPNLQAVFRMRRSEEWTPEDTAHRVGGLPMAQPAQVDCVGWFGYDTSLRLWFETNKGDDGAIPLYKDLQKRSWASLTDDEIKEIVGPYGDTPIKGYTRKLFDQTEAALRSKNA